MSKKKKHQKQKNTEPQQPKEEQRRPVTRTPGYTQTFDAMFSSALQKMLDEQDEEPTRVEDDSYPVVILPETPASAAPGHASGASSRRRYNEDDDRVAAALAGFLDDDGSYDEEAEMPEMPEMPEPVPEQRPAPQHSFAPQQRPAPRHITERRSETELYEDLMQSYSNSPLNNFAVPMPPVEVPHPYERPEAPREEYREEAPVEPEVWEAPREEYREEAPAEPAVPEAPHEEYRRRAPEGYGIWGAPREEFPVEIPREESRAGEPFPTPERPAPFSSVFGRDSEDTSVIFTVPAMPETESVPEQFSVPQTAESDAPETPEFFAFPDTEEEQPEQAVAKRRGSKVRRRKKKHAEKPTEKSEQTLERESIVLPETEPESEFGEGDTGSLLTVIESLIEETKEETAQLSQMAQSDPSPTISFTPVREPKAPETPAARQEFDTAPIPSLGFSMPEPEPEPARPARNFWDEFDELKTLVIDDAPTAAPAAEETPAAEPEHSAEPAAPTGKKQGRGGLFAGMFRNRSKKPERDAAPVTDAEERPAPVIPEAAPVYEEEPAPVIPEAAPVSEEEPAPAVAEDDHAIEEEFPVIEDLFPETEETPAAEASPAAEEAAPSEAAPERTPEEDAVIIQSAGAREEEPKPRPAPVRQPRQKKPTERPTTAEVDVLRPDEAYRVYGKKLGSTGTRLAVAGFVTVISLLLTLYVSLNWSFLPQAISGSAIAYILLALMLVTAALAFDVFKEAAGKLKKVQFTPALLVALTVVSAAIDAIQAAASDRVPLCTPVGVLIVFLLWDKYDGIMGIMTTLRVVRDAKTPTGIVEVQDVMKGRVGLTRADGSVDDFMAKYETKAPTEKFAQIYVPAAAAICTVIAAVIAAKNGVPFLWTLTLMLLGGIPLIGILNFSRLFNILAKRLSESNAALCGWYGAETFGGDHTILAGDEDIFPEGSIRLNGIKVIAQNADRVIAYAAAASKAADIALYPVFDEELRARNGRRYHVERYHFYEGGGIGAEIAGDIVLMGTLDFMRSMGVHMDGGVRIKQAAYISVNGELAAVFAIKLVPSDSVRRGLSAIADNRHFKTVFATRNFLLTPQTISEKYDISLSNTFYPSAKERVRLSEKEMKKQGRQGAILSDGEFGSFADAAAGGRILKSAVRLSILLAIFNAIVGTVLIAVLTSRSGFESANALNILLYQLIWLIPTLLLTGWTRRY